MCEHVSEMAMHSAADVAASVPTLNKGIILEHA